MRLANFFFGPTSDLENFSRLVNLPFLFVLRKVTVTLPGFSSPLSYVFWRMRLAVRKKWQIQVRSGNCVCPIMMDDCKCGKTITHCVVVTPLSPVDGPSVSRFLAHAQI